MPVSKEAYCGFSTGEIIISSQNVIFMSNRAWSVVGIHFHKRSIRDHEMSLARILNRKTSLSMDRRRQRSEGTIFEQELFLVIGERGILDVCGQHKHTKEGNYLLPSFSRGLR